MKSWQKINNILRATLELAIQSQFKFSSDDFIIIESDFFFKFWGGMGRGKNSFGEQFYSLACSSGNRSAAIAFEKWKKRKPFIFFGSRLAEDITFFWWKTIPKEATTPERRKEIVERKYKAIELTVSSFSEDGEVLNAVQRFDTAQPSKRFKIKKEDFKKVEKALK